MGKKSKSSNKQTKKEKNGAQEVPLVDMSREEYDDLCNQIKELTKDEIELEWMESCRHGEIDILRALINTINNADDDDAMIINLTEYSQPLSGNTGLHMACANNHLEVVKYLVEELKHPFVTNDAKNTPLHWAASNGSSDVVEYLLTTTKGKGTGLESIDVLAKNSAGRSALTEGFSSQKEAVVKAILEHDSASEEKLLSAGVPVPVNDDDVPDPENIDKDGNSDMLASHIHHFFDVADEEEDKISDEDQNTNDNSNRPSLLKIRELAMKDADNPFADEDRPDQDTTGLSIWSASLVCARWMIDLCQSQRENKSSTSDNDDVGPQRKELFGGIDEQEQPTTDGHWTALELGSGCGVPGLALAASLLRSKNDENNSDIDSNNNRKVKRKFFVTDLNPQTVDNLKHNIELNDLSPHVEASVMDWDKPESWPSNPDNDGNDNGPAATSPPHALYDVVVGSDLIYQKSLVPLLKSVIERTIKPGGTFLYVCPDTGRDGLDEFITEMKTLCPKWTERVAPKEYHANPLVNGDDEECYMHFNELFQKTFVLYEFPF